MKLILSISANTNRHYYIFLLSSNTDHETKISISLHDVILISLQHGGENSKLTVCYDNPMAIFHVLSRMIVFWTSAFMDLVLLLIYISIHSEI